MEIYAYFLPQFHEIPENNKWWGNGFTEWTNVKKGVPLFNGHKQPLRPLNNNYYNLLDKETVLWQTKLMKKYHIDGLIYYHYYFTDEMLLEKPAENLLSWKDIDQNFFFCWANHSWMRTWLGTKDLLMEQKYGEEKDWEKHFQYLLPFFKDERYVKKENKPLFMLFKSDFVEKNEMFKYFNQRCIDEGFAGICLIESYHGNDWPESYSLLKNNKAICTDYIHFREPAFCNFLYKYDIEKTFEKRIRKWKNKLNKKSWWRWKTPEQFDGNKLCDVKLKYELNDKDIIHGLCFAWDNTCRHGVNGYIISPVSKKYFFKYMDKIKDDKYLFINAWNEWAEGMVLEPTETDGYKYLEWIKEWVESC